MSNPLSSDIAKKTVINIMLTQNVLSEKFNDVLKPYDLSPEQFNVLRILRGNKGIPANMSTIQERMIARTSNTTRLIDKLLTKNFVERQVCPQNRRKIEVSITPKGLDILTTLDPIIITFEHHFTKSLTETELTQLNNLLEKIRS